MICSKKQIYNVEKEEALTFRKRYDSGESIDTISKSTHRGKETIWRWLKRTGQTRSSREGLLLAIKNGYTPSFPPRYKGMYINGGVTKKEEKEFRRLYNSGESSTMIADRFGRNPVTVLDRLKNTGSVRSLKEAIRVAVAAGRFSARRCFRKWNKDENFFSKLNRNSAWVLGLIFGDGNVRERRLLLAFGKDKDVAKKVSALIKYNGPISYRNNCWMLEIYSKKTVESLKSYGVFPAKTYTMKFPRMRRSLLSHFVRGLIESDGHIILSKNHLVLGYSSASRDFIGRLNFILNRIANSKVRVASFKSKKSPNVTYSISYKCKKAKAICDWIYKNSTRKTRGIRKYLNSKIGCILNAS